MNNFTVGLLIGVWGGFCLGIAITSLLSFNKELDKEEDRIYGEIKIKNNK